MTMKTAAWAASLLFLCFNATADVPVFLKTNPAGDVTKGTPITLTADLGREIGALDKSRLRYTFSAQRTWPCADSFVIPNAPIGASGRPVLGMVTWTPPKAGIYTFEVAVDYLPPPRMPNASTQRIGNGRVVNFKVKPTSGFSGMLWPTFAPASNAAAPVNLRLTVAAVGTIVISTTTSHPVVPVRLIARVDCQGGCNPPSCAADGFGAAVCSFQLPAAGTYTFSAAADQMSPTDCQWLGSASAPLGSYTAK